MPNIWAATLKFLGLHKPPEPVTAPEPPPAPPLSQYDASIARFKRAAVPGREVNRDLRGIVTHESCIVNHCKVLRSAIWYMAEKKIFPPQSFTEVLLPRHQFFKDEKGHYIDTTFWWARLVEDSVEFLDWYQKEMNSTESSSQVNYYRLAPIASIVVTMSSQIPLLED